MRTARQQLGINGAPRNMRRISKETTAGKEERIAIAEGYRTNVRTQRGYDQEFIEA
jgi:hypothetical protein